MKKALIPQEIITSKILLIRNKKVMLDRDLASLYGVTTKVLNQAVKRNLRRFPEDFMFRLTITEKNELVTNCDQFKILKHSSAMPHVFTEHGIAMLSSVLNSERAIQVNIAIVRVFVSLREFLVGHTELAFRVTDLENKMIHKNEEIQAIFNIIRQLMNLNDKPIKVIRGFGKDE